MTWSAQVLDTAVAAAQQGLRGEARRAAVAALEEFRPLGPALEARAPAAFAQAVGLAALGEVGQARALWLRDGATEGEAWGAFGAAQDKAEGAAAQREREWEELWSAIGRATLTGLRYALPFLLLAVSA